MLVGAAACQSTITDDQNNALGKVLGTLALQQNLVNVLLLHSELETLALLGQFVTHVSYESGEMLVSVVGPWLLVLLLICILVIVHLAG